MNFQSLELTTIASLKLKDELTFKGGVMSRSVY
jgi:hypothetical protein